MTTQTEALKLALEALETYHGYMEPLLTVFGGPRVPAEKSTTYKVERAITAIKEDLAQPEQEPVAFLANGARFKLTFDAKGRVSSLWHNMQELDGRWVALVAADDDCHLKLTTPPQRKPLTYVDLRRIANQCGLGANKVSAQTQATVDNFARAIEAAHGIKGD